MRIHITTHRWTVWSQGSNFNCCEKLDSFYSRPMQLQWAKYRWFQWFKLISPWSWGSLNTYYLYVNIHLKQATSIQRNEIRDQSCFLFFSCHLCWNTPFSLTFYICLVLICCLIFCCLHRTVQLPLKVVSFIYFLFHARAVEHTVKWVILFLWLYNSIFSTTGEQIVW